MRELGIWVPTFNLMVRKLSVQKDTNATGEVHKADSLTAICELVF
jgi:hypothetical protein